MKKQYNLKKLKKANTIKAFSTIGFDQLRAKTCKDNCDESGGSYTAGPSADVKERYQKQYWVFLYLLLIEL